MLVIKYFDEMKGAPTLLISGSLSDVEQVARFFNTWNGKRVDLVEYINQYTEVDLSGIRKLEVESSLSGTDSYVENIKDTCIWRITESGKMRISGLLQGLVESEEPAHQYLDSRNSLVQIICSKDEYNFSQ
ncbi:MAG: hypothetical protein GC149_14350 [Gammaproteobacteria bacterium]|nr:hypothetical protein [Gammaproteobacteria bacterium]